MTNPAPSPFAFVRAFNPVFTRDRHDGWKPEKQVAFIAALAESGCVTDACRRVGMSTESAYALKRRYDAVDFRLTWDAALEYAVQRLSDAALSRAIHGVPVPHYYKGAVVGEHRRFNETLTMFILRYRDPVTYAKSWDRQNVLGGHPEERAERLAVGIDNIIGDHSRRYCERNAAKDATEDAAAYAIAKLDAEREAAYQAHIKAEDAAKAAAVAIAVTARAAQAAEMARAAEITRAANETRAARGDGTDGNLDGLDGLDEDMATAIAGNAFHSSVASTSSTSGADDAPPPRPEAGPGSAIPPDAPAPAATLPPADTVDKAALEAAALTSGYRIVRADPPPRGPGPPYWAQRIF